MEPEMELQPCRPHVHMCLVRVLCVCVRSLYVDTLLSCVCVDTRCVGVDV